MSTKILGNEELNILRAKTPYSLPDNPSDKGFNARQIKTKFWEGYLLLFNWLKDTQASVNNDFATTNSALLNESKRIDVILTYFNDGKANFAVRDRNNNIIDETYELKSEASIKFNQLISDIQSVQSASGNKIAGTQNINADGIQYTITLNNTQNATLSTITQYLPLATTLKAGLLSSSDKEKINNIESDLTNFLANAKAYTDEKLERDNIVNILGAASHTLIGLLTSEDKKKIDALYALLGEKEDADTVVNTINEVLAIFSNYPEGVDIVSQLEKKVNYSDVINTLDSEETSKPLSAKMGKELKTEVDTKAELAYVNEELDKKALKSDILVIDEAVTAQESEITTTQSEGDKLVDEIVGYIDGSPRGVYASLSSLQSALPSGAQGVYVTTDNGHWYYWNGSAWTDGGVYQTAVNYDELENGIDNLNDVVDITNMVNVNDNTMINEGYYIYEGPGNNRYNCFNDQNSIFVAHGSMVSTYPIKVDRQKIHIRVIYTSIAKLIEYDINGNFIRYTNASKTGNSSLAQYPVWDSDITLHQNTSYIMLSSYISDYKKAMNISYNQPDDVTLPYNKWYLKNDYAISLINQISSTNSKLYGKRIAYFGDSLMHGMEVNYNGWESKEDVFGGIWKRLNEKYNLIMKANLSEGGTCLQPWGGLTSDTSSIAYKMANYDNTNTDIVLFTGGFNDAYKIINNDANFTLGQVSQPYVNSYEDYSTICSSLETAIVNLKNKNPHCKIFWIKTWKAGVSSQEAMSILENVFNKLTEVCNKYSIPIIDLYNNSNFILFIQTDRNVYGRPNYNAETGAVSHDYTHLSTAGYDAIMPLIENVLKSNL